MKSELPIRLVLVDPPTGIDFGIQRGKGSNFECVSVQRSNRGDLTFDVSLIVSNEPDDGPPNFTGPFAQGPPSGRFLYVNVGTFAGQTNTPWSRRMKVPLGGINWPLVLKAASLPDSRLTATIPGTGKDGGPSCATVKLIGTWEVCTT